MDHLEQTGRPLRIAIDVAIWQFQVQAARGGSNPAIRTLFYRLLRLLSLHIEPVFVFDGPNKPVFKRNKRSGRGDGVAAAMAKRLIRLFGFIAHDSPGEAEAECAFLQQNGIVDAVLSEDVDTIMFGCTRTLRNWSAEGKGQTPTHVSLYDTADLHQSESGLDREGMVLVALMSGGDYIPEGIPGAGVKLACEAARAGFGKSICRFKRSDVQGLEDWRADLKNELVTNASRFFRTKHKALKIPEDFPNMDVLRYYTHPVVSPTSALDRLRNQSWNTPMDVLGLREFVGETFDWNYRDGAIKFIRVLAPCLLVQKIMRLSGSDVHRSDNVEQLQKEETDLVRSVTNRREHFSTDATPELRISFIPTSIVGHNFEEEPEEEILFGRQGLALNSDDEFEAADAEGRPLTKSGPKKPFSPTEPDLFWMPETIAKLGLPLLVEDWEDSQRARGAKKSKTMAPKLMTKARLGGMQVGALDKFVKVSKNVPPDEKLTKLLQNDKTERPSRARSPLGVLTCPLQKQPGLPAANNPVSKPLQISPTTSKLPVKSKKSPRKPQTARSHSTVNPWSITSSLPPRKKKSTTAAAIQTAETICISSSPVTSPFKASCPRVSWTSSPSPSENDLDSLVTSVQKRRSVTPLDGSQMKSRSTTESRPSSPTPQQGTRSRRKLARTESMPTESPRGAKNLDIFGTRRAPLSRHHTIAAEPQPEELEESGDDLDLPPLSTLTSRIPRASSSAPSASAVPPDNSLPLHGTSTSVTVDSSLPPSSVLTAGKSASASWKPPVTTKTVVLNKATTISKKQGKLGETFGMRTTKIFMPRKSEPGFFKEVEVTIDEAERMQSESGNTRKWRQSDVSVIDLTGDD